VIGLSNLEKAAERFPDVQYEVWRRPFFLYSDLPAKASDPTPEYPLAWGPRLDALYGPGARGSIERLGAAAGYNFNFSAEGSSTFDSHRILLWSETKGVGVPMGKALARRYFEEGKRLADHSVLLSAVEEVGLTREEAAGVLESDQFRQEVRQAVARSRAEGISSIPVFIFSSESGKSAVVQGSASPADFVRVFEQAAACTA